MYVASGAQSLEEAVAAKQTAWCGLAGWLSWDAHSCVTRISPFQETTVAALKPSFFSGAPFPSFTPVTPLWCHIPYILLRAGLKACLGGLWTRHAAMGSTSSTCCKRVPGCPLPGRVLRS